MCGFMVYTGKKEELNGFDAEFAKIAHRGPDHSQIVSWDEGTMAFHRLSVMGVEGEAGNQPFSLSTGDKLVCNGEIYNYRTLKTLVDFDFQSESDCEVLLPLYKKVGIKELALKCDGEFAFVLWDEAESSFKAARDPMGIRPLFYGTTKEGKLFFSSEVKSLQKFCLDIKAFPPGHYFDGKDILPFIDLGVVESYHEHSINEVYKNVHDKLFKAVEKRLHSHSKMGYLLSGGLDSSLVCSIAQKVADRDGSGPIKTFAIGMEHDAIDLKYAKQVAEHIGSNHTEVIITKDDVIGAIRDVVWHLETYDITTIRASVGMYLICKYIQKHTDVKVLLTGEVSDEIFGYKYTDYAPSPEEFQKEAAKRVRELYMYDVLRADRCINASSLEARVPFSDTEFVQYVMSIDPQMKMNTTGKGKYILRKAFEGDYLPHSILWREKAAFSDAVGHSLVDFIKEYAESLYTEKELTERAGKYEHATPFTKESLMYRDLFEEFFPKRSYLVVDFWMPNKEWDNCDVKDPSARVLPNYGDSAA